MLTAKVKLSRSQAVLPLLCRRKAEGSAFFAEDWLMNVISGFDWDRDRGSDRPLGPKALNKVGQTLREAYRDVLEQGVPEHFLVLLERLDQHEGNGGGSGDA